MRWIARLLFIGTLLILWELGVQFNLIQEFYFSKPSLILSKLWSWVLDGTLIHHALYTLLEAFLGFLIGIILGSLVAYITYKKKLLKNFLIPIFNVLNSLPRIAFAPLIILLFGFGLFSKVIIVISLVFFVSFYYVFESLENLKPEIKNRFQLLNLSNSENLAHLYLPVIINSNISALNLNVAYSLIGAIIGEYIGSSRGLGYLIDNAGSMFDSTGVYSGLFTLVIIVAILNIAIVTVQSRYSYINY